MARGPSADYKLAHENYPGLNESFYKTRPWNYFYYRLNHLVLVAAKQEDVAKLLDEPFKVGERLTVGPRDRSGDGDPERERIADADLKAFVAAEAAVLLYHTSETLLRVYLVHEDRDGKPPFSECPVLDIARGRNHAAFKEKVEKRFLGNLDQEERRKRARLVFYGTNDQSAFRERPPDDAWTGGPDNIENFLRYYAETFVDADLYNAAKHGLAIHPGEVAMQLANNQGEEILGAKGHAIEYLAEREEKDGSRTWTRATKWVDLELNAAFIMTAMEFMKSIWTVARARYCGEMPEAGVSFYDKQPLFDHMFTGMEGIKVSTMHMPLLYYADQPPNGAPPDSSW
jgi:hypothetical protein